MRDLVRDLVLDLARDLARDLSHNYFFFGFSMVPLNSIVAVTLMCGMVGMHLNDVSILKA